MQDIKLGRDIGVTADGTDRGGHRSAVSDSPKRLVI